MLSYYEMMRPGNCLMTLVAVFIGGLLVFRWELSAVSGYPVLLAMLAAFLIAGAGNVANDIADIEADKVNRPKRPLPNGKVSKNRAILYALILFAAGNLLAASINWLAFIIALLNSAVLLAYSHSLQHKVYVGNIAVSYLTASSFLFGSAAAGKSVEYMLLPLIMALMAFFASLSREIIKDLEDIEGDRFSFIRKITAKLNKKVAAIAERFSIRDGRPTLSYDTKTAATLAMVSLIAAVLISPLPWTMGILGLYYMAVVIPADLVMVAAAIRLYFSTSRRSLSEVSRMIKTGMSLGLLAFVVGVLL